jgi:hypothetical protein
MVTATTDSSKEVPESKLIAYGRTTLVLFSASFPVPPNLAILG